MKVKIIESYFERITIELEDKDYIRMMNNYKLSNLHRLKIFGDYEYLVSTNGQDPLQEMKNLGFTCYHLVFFKKSGLNYQPQGCYIVECKDQHELHYHKLAFNNRILDPMKISYTNMHFYMWKVSWDFIFANLLSYDQPII